MKIIIAITGASGAIYGIRLLEMLKNLNQVETHLIISKTAGITIKHETNYTVSEVKEMANYHYNVDDISACIASGSFKTNGMIISPCSIKTMSAIAHSFCDNLITRAADVILKEKRKLALILRETPLHLIHLRNLTQIAEAGGIIYPPVPAFYAKLTSIDDLVDQTLYRILDLFNIEMSNLKRWKGLGC